MGFLGKGGMMARRKEQLNYQDTLAYGDHIAPPDPEPAETSFPENDENRSPLSDLPPDAPGHQDALTDVPLPDPGPGELPDLGMGAGPDDQPGLEQPDEGLGLQPGADDQTEIAPAAGPQSPETPAAAPGIETSALADARRKVAMLMANHIQGV